MTPNRKVPLVAGIVVTHGKIAEELLRTAKSVFGEFSDCFAISNMSKSTELLAQEVNAVVDSVKGKRCIIFVDFVGGSCSHACLSRLGLRDTGPDVPIISGVNLPMVLAFLNKRDEVPFDQLTDAIVERSCNSIQVLDPSKI